MKNMVVHVKTSTSKSEVSAELGITEDEWNKLSEDERIRLEENAVFDLIESWVVVE